MVSIHSLAIAIVSLLGMYLASIYGRKVKRFMWSEYILLLAAPVTASLGLAYFYGYKVFILFFFSAVIGFVLEYLLGFFYYKSFHRHLWFYSRFSIQGYTSFLTIPMWGVAGVVFWLLAKNIGL